MDSSASLNPKKDYVLEETQEELITPGNRGNRKTFVNSSGATSQPEKEAKVLSPRSRFGSITLGPKRIETNSFVTTARGVLLVHQNLVLRTWARILQPAN